MNQAKHKGAFLYTMACALLSVMSFTAVTAFADTGDIFNTNHVGMYVNEANSNASIILTNTGTYAVYVNAVRGKINNSSIHYINGCTSEDVYMKTGLNGTTIKNGFHAFFSKARPSDEDGIPGDTWLRNVDVWGDVTTKFVLLKPMQITIENTADNAKFIKN